MAEPQPPELVSLSVRTGREKENNTPNYMEMLRDKAFNENYGNYGPPARREKDRNEAEKVFDERYYKVDQANNRMTCIQLHNEKPRFDSDPHNTEIVNVNGSRVEVNARFWVIENKKPNPGDPNTGTGETKSYIFGKDNKWYLETHNKYKVGDRGRVEFWDQVTISPIDEDTVKKDVFGEVLEAPKQASPLEPVSNSSVKSSDSVFTNDQGTQVDLNEKVPPFVPPIPDAQPGKEQELMDEIEKLRPRPVVTETDTVPSQTNLPEDTIDTPITTSNKETSKWTSLIEISLLNSQSLKEEKGEGMSEQTKDYLDTKYKKRFFGTTADGNAYVAVHMKDGSETPDKAGAAVYDANNNKVINTDEKTSKIFDSSGNEIRDKIISKVWVIQKYKVNYPVTPGQDTPEQPAVCYLLTENHGWIEQAAAKPTPVKKSERRNLTELDMNLLDGYNWKADSKRELTDQEMEQNLREIASSLNPVVELTQ